MRYNNGLSYSDNVFIRAVELGCQPIPAPHASILGPWLCLCQNSEHTSEEDHTITWGKIVRLENAEVA